jgi:hypothetical protein
MPREQPAATSTFPERVFLGTTSSSSSSWNYIIPCATPFENLPSQSLHTFIPRTLLLLISSLPRLPLFPGLLRFHPFPSSLQDGISCPTEQGDSDMQPQLHNHDLGTGTKLWAELARLQEDNANVSATIKVTKAELDVRKVESKSLQQTVSLTDPPPLTSCSFFAD